MKFNGSLFISALAAGLVVWAIDTFLFKKKITPDGNEEVSFLGRK